MKETLEQIKADYRAKVNCNCSLCQVISTKVEAFLGRAFEAGKQSHV